MGLLDENEDVDEGTEEEKEEDEEEKDDRMRRHSVSTSCFELDSSTTYGMLEHSIRLDIFWMFYCFPSA